MELDLGAIIAAVVIAATAGGSWFQGRNNGASVALSTASDVVGMLANQVAMLESKNRVVEVERDEWRTRYLALEGYREASERCREADCPGRSARDSGTPDG